MEIKKLQRYYSTGVPARQGVQTTVVRCDSSSCQSASIIVQYIRSIDVLLRSSKLVFEKVVGDVEQRKWWSTVIIAGDS